MWPAIVAALASTIASKGIDAAMGGGSVTGADTIPQMPGGGGMDLNQLVQQKQSNLPKLTIEDLMRMSQQQN